MTLYIGCFEFNEERPAGETEQDGYFQMVVDAADPEEALQRFTRAAAKLQQSTAFATQHKKVSVFLSTMIEVEKAGPAPTMINFAQYDAAPLPRGAVCCSIPDTPKRCAKIHSYSTTPPDAGTREREPIVVLGE